jgi:U2 small nuclear ribonucleoprotein A'
MVKLTAELIEDSHQYVNPVREYELSLRGYKIGLIENLGATLNQFDTIDFTDNDIRRLDGFPLLNKLKSLLFSNNKIQHVGNKLDKSLPNLGSLVLTNNNIEDLSEIDQLSTLKNLKVLSLLRNPISLLKHYRLYTIYRIPSLKILDFKKVKETEREQAQKLYKGKKLKTSEKPNTFVPGEQLDKMNLGQNAANNRGFDQQSRQNMTTQRSQPTKEDIESIKRAISQAKSIEEIEQLNAMLRSGIIPSNLRQHHQSGYSRSSGNQMVEEEDDDDRMQR